MVIKDFEDNTIKFYATSHIEAFSEITIDYTDGDPLKSNLWFDEKE